MKNEIRDYKIISGEQEVEVDTELFVPKERIDEEQVKIMRSFHENTKIRSYEVPPTSISHILNRSAMVSLARLDRRKTRVKGGDVSLPQRPPESNSEFWSTVIERRSASHFSGRGLAPETIAGILYSGLAIVSRADGAYGGSELRTAPSAGAIYPLDPYLIVVRIHNIDSGVYYYDSKARELCKVSDEIPAAKLVEAMAGQKFVGTADVIIVLAGVFPRIFWKYGARGYRYVLLEAGHVIHAFCLASQFYRVAARAIGGFLDDHVNCILGLDGRDETAIYAVAIGSS